MCGAQGQRGPQRVQGQRISAGERFCCLCVFLIIISRVEIKTRGRACPDHSFVMSQDWDQGPYLESWLPKSSEGNWPGPIFCLGQCRVGQPPGLGGVAGLNFPAAPRTLAYFWVSLFFYSSPQPHQLKAWTAHSRTQSSQCLGYRSLGCGCLPGSFWGP